MHQTVEGDPQAEEEPEAVFIYERIEDGDCFQTNMTDEQIIEILTFYIRRGQTVH